MSEWEECTIGSLGTVITGKTPSKNTPEEWGEEYLFITPTDYSSYNKYAFFSKRKLSENGCSKHIRRKIPINSSLVTCIGSDMGKVVKNSEAAFTNQQINAFIPNEKLVNHDYVYYFFKNSHLLLKTLGSDGTAVPILNKSDFEKISITIPPIGEQEIIASVLSSLDDKIDLLHRQNKTLESMAETLFRQWFVEEAQEDWEHVKLSELGKIICGKTPLKNNPTYYSNDIPFLKIPDMHGKTYVINTIDNLSFEGANSQKNKLVRAGSICVSCIATVGLVCLTEQDIHTNQQINSIIPIDNIYKYFLFLYMKSMHEELNNMASGGTATLNLNTNNFSNIKIPLPASNILKKFNEIVIPVFDKIYSNSLQIKSLESLRDTLLPKLMNGEVRVKFEASQV